MSNIFSLTITAGASKSQGETRAAETQLVAECLHKAATAVQSGHTASGTLVDRNGTNVGSFTYSPTASQ